MNPAIVWIVVAALSTGGSTVIIAADEHFGVYASKPKCEQMAHTMRFLGSDSPGIHTECRPYQVQP